MKIKITKISDFNYEEYRSIKTLQDLLDIIKEFENRIIIEQGSDCDISIIIYDTYF